MKRILIFFIRAYQKLLSPLLGSNCRFTPTCSHYAIEALEVHGAAKGSVLALWRIVRCNPLGACGPDPVPPKGAWPQNACLVVPKARRMRAEASLQELLTDALEAPPQEALPEEAREKSAPKAPQHENL